MNYVQLSTLDKKLYQVHKTLLAAQDDQYLKRMIFGLALFDLDKYVALRTALAGELRRRKMTV